MKNSVPAAIACAIISSASAAFGNVTLSGSIVWRCGTPVGELAVGGPGVISSIDHIPFVVYSETAARIDLLSWEFNSPSAFDTNGDGEIAFFDPVIHLFHDDGSLDPADLIATNDDSFDTFGDGSINFADSLLALDLLKGNYILTVGAYNHTLADAIAGVNPGTGGDIYPVTLDEFRNFRVSDHGDYCVTFTGDISIVPAPSAAALLGLGGLMTSRRRRR